MCQIGKTEDCNMDLYEAFVEAGGAKFIELLCLGMVRIGEHAACRNSLTIGYPAESASPRLQS